MIPTVPGSEIDVNTPASSVKLDAGALSAGNRGTLAIAGSVDGLGEQFQKLGQDLTKVRDTRIAADADFKMRAAQHAFVTSTQGDENEQQWSERAAKTFETVREDLYASHKIPPSMRPQLDDQLKCWGQTLQIKAATMAAVQSVNRATVAVQKSYEEAGRDGDAMGMANAVALGRSSKLDPVEMDRMEIAIPRTLALTAIENGLRANPQGTHELLASGEALPVVDQHGNPIVPSKVFPQKELQSLVTASRVHAATWQKTNFEGMLQDAADPITGMVPDSVIKAKIDSGEINVRAGNALKDAQDRKLRAENTATETENRRALAEFDREDRDRFNVLQSAIHDPAQWGASPDEYAAQLTAQAGEISNKARRAQAIGDVNRQLNAVKKTGQLAQRPLETQIMALMREDRESQGAMVPLAVADVTADAGSSGFLGMGKRPATGARTTYQSVAGGIAAIRKMDDTEIKGTFGESATKDSVIDSINVHAARLENEMREWFKSPEGVKATFEQANAHRQMLERPFVMDAVRATLSKKPPEEVTTKEEFDQLPPGAPFIFKGQAGIKN